MRKALALTLLLLFSGTACSTEYTAGFEYRSINEQPTANPKRIEVIESFGMAAHIASILSLH